MWACGEGNARSRERHGWLDASALPTIDGMRFVNHVVAAALFLRAACAGRATNAVAPEARRALLLDPANAEWRRPAPAISHLRFETTKGVFVLEVHRDWGPIGADRLYNLARLGYYDDTRFHRVNKNYIAQFGLHGTPAVNAAWKNRQIMDDP